MRKFGEAPLTRAELEEHCFCALAAARHACAELAEDLNEATDAELVERAMLARRLVAASLPMLLPREPHRQKAGYALLSAIPKSELPKEGRGLGSFAAWLMGYRAVTRADITPRPA